MTHLCSALKESPEYEQGFVFIRTTLDIGLHGTSLEFKLSVWSGQGGGISAALMRRRITEDSGYLR